MISVGQEYTDDCSAGSTNPELIDKLQETLPQQLHNFGLCVNEEKTERFTFKHNKDDTWKIQYYYRVKIRYRM